VPLVANYPITLVVEGRRLTGVAACNSYWADTHRSGATIQVTEVVKSAMDCGRGDVMAAEAAYLRMLPTIASIGDSQPDQLILEGPDLIFEFAPSEHELPLTNLTWNLVEARNNQAETTSPPSRPSMLAFRGTDSLLAWTGCRHIIARYDTRGAQIVVSVSQTRGECPPWMEKQDGAIVGLLGDGFDLDRGEARLTLSDQTATFVYELVRHPS